jgi:hypothetical protein
MVPLLSAERHWACPLCKVTAVTYEARPHTSMHTCAGLHGLTAPLIPVGTKAKLTAVEREDYIGNDTVTRDDNGRPVMAVITERNDGQDATVFAPLVKMRSTR